MAVITLTIPDDLVVTYQRFQQENGATWAEAYVTEKLRELAQRHEEQDAREFHAKLKLLVPADQAAVLADNQAVGCLYLAGLCRQVLGQEILKAALADKADAGAVFFVVGDQAVLLGDAAHFGFFQLAYGK